MAAEAEAIRFAGDVSIDKIEIITGSTGFGQDVTNQVVAFEFYEDIFSPFFSGILALKDSLDLANLFPFVGEEYVNIKFHTPTFTGKDKVIDDQFYIFKMSNRERSGDRSVIYELHFMSREALVDLNKRASKPYFGKCSDIARNIITDKVDGLESIKNVNIEETPNGVKFIANWWPPVQSLNYAAETAANINGSAAYIFFENRIGLNFMSLENMYKGAVKQEFIYDSYFRDFLPDGRSTRNVEEEYKRIIDIKIPVVYDYIDRSRSGMYASKMISYDLTTKKYAVKGFDYIDDFPTEKHLNEFPLTSRAVVRRSNNLIINQNKYYGNFNNFGDVTNSKTIQKRLSLINQAEANTIQITVPGRTDYTVGQKVYVTLYKYNPIDSTETTEKIIDNIFSGNYLIAAINHVIDREKHQCVMELIKDSFIVDMNKGGM